jgi:hypothetical protein
MGKPRKILRKSIYVHTYIYNHIYIYPTDLLKGLWLSAAATRTPSASVELFGANIYIYIVCMHRNEFIA